jgi:hypothetical protein
MEEKAILGLPAMPLAARSCPRGPYRFLALPYGRMLHDDRASR